MSPVLWVCVEYVKIGRLEGAGEQQSCTENEHESMARSDSKSWTQLARKYQNQVVFPKLVRSFFSKNRALS